MSDKTPDNNQADASAEGVTRRKLLQRVAAGGVVLSLPVLPAKWTKPVIDTVIVPAHAQGVSGPSPSGGATSPTPSASPGVSPSATPGPTPSSTPGASPSPSPSATPTPSPSFIDE